MTGGPRTVTGVWRVAAVVTIAWLALPPDVSGQGCAMCRRALQSPEGQQLIAAFRNGILLLLAAPFLTFATVATLAVRASRCRKSGEKTGTGLEPRQGVDA